MNLSKRPSGEHPRMSFVIAATALAFSALPLTGLLADDSDPSSPASAEDKTILRVCAAASEAPYSQQDASGFENKLAKILADAMGRKIVFIWSNKPAIYAVRDQLDKKRCDVVMGMDTGDERVSTSRPYYKAPYVFVMRKDSPLKIDSWDSPDLHKAGKISFVQGTPAETMMTKIDLYNDNINYVSSLTNFKDRRNSYTRVPPDRMVNEVADKTADIAVAFAPEVAHYVKANGELTMIVIPDNNVRADGQRVPHHFDQSVGVRKDDKELLAAIDAAIAKAQPDLEKVLKDEGIPIIPAPPRT